MQEFSLLIKPASADCNLRCCYCFYLDRAALYPQVHVHRMSEDTLEAMIASYQALPLRRHLYGWQGGEPTLMGLEFFRRAVALQKQYARPGSVIANTLQTNGTLLDDPMAAFFREEHFLLGVSLDGPAELHDPNRPTAGGEATHARVQAGIAALRRQQAEFNILTLVNRRNGRDGTALYRYLCEQGHRFLQFIPCVESGPDGTAAPHNISAGDWGRFLCEVYDAWRSRDTRTVSVRLFDTILAYLLTGERNCCEMAGDCRSYLVVEYNGDLYPCDFHVMPEWKLGNLHTDGWEDLLRSARYQDFGAQKRNWSSRCAQCPYLALCAGGCPKNRRAGKGIDALCEGWQMFYAHALPGLRDLADSIRRESAPAVDAAPARPATVQPNDRCPCGSGKKLKRCCGAGKR